jgi:hypothetical protein
MTRPDRWVVVAASLAVGTALLGYGLHSRGDSAGFYVGTLAAAGVWFAGGVAAGPVPWRPRPVAGSVDRSGMGAWPPARQLAGAAGIGVALYGLLVALDLVVRQIPFLSHALDRILADADRGPLLAVLLLTLVNAVAEEVFFRGALYDTLGRRFDERATVALAITVYVLVTAVSANLVLIAAAVLVGAATTLERRETGGIGPTVVTHVVWSALMVTAFPR